MTTWPPTVKSAPPPTQQWIPPVSVPSASESVPSFEVPAPAVPGGGSAGSRNIVVTTPSLDLFAANIGELMGPVKQAWTQLGQLPAVAAGAFPEAYQILAKVSGIHSGPSTIAGMVNDYQNVLNDLYNGLGKIQTATQQMSRTYTNIDQLNTMSATDLQNDLNDSQGYFSAMISANGGK